MKTVNGVEMGGDEETKFRWYRGESCHLDECLV